MPNDAPVDASSGFDGPLQTHIDSSRAATLKDTRRLQAMRANWRTAAILHSQELIQTAFEESKLASSKVSVSCCGLVPSVPASRRLLAILLRLCGAARGHLPLLPFRFPLARNVLYEFIFSAIKEKWKKRKERTKRTNERMEERQKEREHK